jgi:hypothetical protein
MAYGPHSHTSSILRIANGNGHGNILQSWAILTNRSRVAFRDESSASDIAIAAQPCAGLI